jgi:hypothetical protein
MLICTISYEARANRVRGALGPPSPRPTAGRTSYKGFIRTRERLTYSELARVWGTYHGLAKRAPGVWVTCPIHTPAYPTAHPIYGRRSIYRRIRIKRILILPRRPIRMSRDLFHPLTECVGEPTSPHILAVGCCWQLIKLPRQAR